MAIQICFHIQAGIKGLVLAAMVYRSVGVIFGDLGTSPMYIYPSTFDHPPSRSDVMGALSLILWTLSLLALVKYVLIVLWANDDGEGIPASLSWGAPQGRGVGGVVGVFPFSSGVVRWQQITFNAVQAQVRDLMSTKEEWEDCIVGQEYVVIGGEVEDCQHPAVMVGAKK